PVRDASPPRRPTSPRPRTGRRRGPASATALAFPCSLLPALPRGRTTRNLGARHRRSHYPRGNGRRPVAALVFGMPRASTSPRVVPLPPPAATPFGRLLREWR